MTIRYRKSSSNAGDTFLETGVLAESALGELNTVCCCAHTTAQLIYSTFLSNAITLQLFFAPLSLLHFRFDSIMLSKVNIINGNIQENNTKEDGCVLGSSAM
jgi:hypothetical protein